MELLLEVESKLIVLSAWYPDVEGCGSSKTDDDCWTSSDMDDDGWTSSDIDDEGRVSMSEWRRR